MHRGPPGGGVFGSIIQRYFRNALVRDWLLDSAPISSVTASSLRHSFVYGIGFGKKRCTSSTLDIEDLLIVTHNRPPFICGVISGLGQPHVFSKTPFMNNSVPVVRRFAADLSRTDCLEFLEFVHFNDGKLVVFVRHFLTTPDYTLPVVAKAVLFSGTATTNTTTAEISQGTENSNNYNYNYKFGKVLMKAEMKEIANCPACTRSAEACACSRASSASLPSPPLKLTTHNWGQYAASFVHKARRGMTSLQLFVPIAGHDYTQIFSTYVPSLTCVSFGDSSYMRTMQQKSIHALGIQVLLPRTEAKLSSSSNDWCRAHDVYVARKRTRHEHITIECEESEPHNNINNTNSMQPRSKQRRSKRLAPIDTPESQLQPGYIHPYQQLEQLQLQLQQRNTQLQLSSTYPHSNQTQQENCSHNADLQRHQLPASCLSPVEPGDAPHTYQPPSAPDTSINTGAASSSAGTTSISADDFAAISDVVDMSIDISSSPTSTMQPIMIPTINFTNASPGETTVAHLPEKRYNPQVRNANGNENGNRRRSNGDIVPMRVATATAVPGTKAFSNNSYAVPGNTVSGAVTKPTAIVPTDKKKHACDRCASRFKMRGDLQRHIKTVHEGHKMFSCGECGKSFGHSGHLNRHVQSVHQQKRRHKCKHCGDSFFQVSHLKSHISHIHDKSKAWECHLCALRLSSEKGLRNHLRNLHNAQPSWNCQVSDCNKKFLLQTDLSRHIKKSHEFPPNSNAFVNI